MFLIKLNLFILFKKIIETNLSLLFLLKHKTIVFGSQLIQFLLEIISSIRKYIRLRLGQSTYILSLSSTELIQSVSIHMIVLISIKLFLIIFLPQKLLNEIFRHSFIVILLSTTLLRHSIHSA